MEQVEVGPEKYKNEGKESLTSKKPLAQEWNWCSGATFYTGILLCDQH